MQTDKSSTAPVFGVETEVFSFGGWRDESERTNEKEKCTKNPTGRRRIVRRRSLNHKFKSGGLGEGVQQ